MQNRVCSCFKLLSSTQWLKHILPVVFSNCPILSLGLIYSAEKYSDRMSSLTMEHKLPK